MKKRSVEKLVAQEVSPCLQISSHPPGKILKNQSQIDSVQFQSKSGGGHQLALNGPGRL
ncbi:MAG: hypothetical protein H7061_01975 [Bdellovibrionaceae bacterium]|nr:hypothetical protein [Bdellovibrio sp.]